MNSWDHAELYSEDEHGERIKHRPPSEHEIHIRETKPHALSHPDRDDLDHGMTLAVSLLSEDERAVLTFQGKLEVRVEHKVEIMAGDLEDYQRDGYTLIPGSGNTVEHDGRTFNVVSVVGWELEQVEELDYAAIAERMGKTSGEVHALVKSAHRKLRRR